MYAPVWTLKQNKWSKSLKEKMRKQVVDVGKLKWYTAQPIEVGWSNPSILKNHHHLLASVHHWLFMNTMTSE